MIDMIDIIANDDHEMLECEECEECFPDYEDFKTQDDFKFCVPDGYYCEACSESLIEKKEEEEEEEEESEEEEEENCLEMIKEIEDYVKDKYAVVLKKYKMGFKRKLSGVIL
tara:strand:- start:1113 stop:1448 length:336 start_codon:yes stop_codon:yes gene_type:complete